ncbi:NmrA family NAD(P)-binding protein (plasmid) [Sphingobium sp. SJ10-10]|uniref:NmrA family NAD(P)-binding protein n=1 Tax=Sphingobium sp. SJ10-10 TaxID=3114999 RepID=UPI002E17EC25|nr:NmrA family NAD(P)-binding protein [Sphingobium sp. SJ10-10]
MPQVDPRPILVTGATGGQGGSVARHALQKGLPVRALVRDPASEAALALVKAGAEIAQGAFDDETALAAAMKGVRGVFSMQQDGAPLAEFRKLLDAAVAAGVEQYVHSTVSGVREQEAVSGNAVDAIKGEYWPTKIAQEHMVREAVFRHRTILRPSLVLDNLVLRAPFMYPRLATEGDLLIAMPPDQPVSFISYDTIGRVAAEALADPDRFDGAEIELADAYASYAQLGAALESVSGKAVTVTSVDVDEAIKLGLLPRVAHSHLWLTDVGYPARPEMLKAFGIEPLTLDGWARRNIEAILVGG